jgi:NAD kinase
MASFDKIVVITQKTGLEELVERYNTREQARYYLENMGISFVSYQSAHDVYKSSLLALQDSLPDDVRHQFVEKSFLPNFLFGERDLIVTLGRDGLVINTAKYLTVQPLIAINPDPEKIDGVLMPFSVMHAESVVRRVLAGEYSLRHVTMAKASLNDGQILYAVNDLFIGQRTQRSAYYKIEFQGMAEDQISSGIIVSTGAGSTGWLRGIMTGAVGILKASSGGKPQIKHSQGSHHRATDRYRFDWEANHLLFSVREPFPTKVSGVELIHGRIDMGNELIITSQMPQNGVIFSDGIEADYLEFNSGRIARVGVAEKKVNLVV